MDQVNKYVKLGEFTDKSLLIVDDDAPFRDRLSRAMERKGFEVIQAEGVKQGINCVKLKKPAFAVVDLRLNDGNGLEIVKAIQEGKALLADPKHKPQPPENPMSADRVKWEHIHRVFELCNRNVSETARRLKMHRRTLQRILYKRSPK